MAIRGVQLDETGYWVQSVTNRAGKIFAVYVYDDELGVHCCEGTPSHELHFVGSFFTASIDDDEAREQLCSDIMDGNREQSLVEYVHCWRIRGMDEIKWCGSDEKPGTFAIEPGDPEESDKEQIESAMEWLRGNSPVI